MSNATARRLLYRTSFLLLRLAYTLRRLGLSADALLIMRLSHWVKRFATGRNRRR